MILARRSLHIKELVIRAAVNLNRPGSILCHRDWTVQIPWTQDQLLQLIVREETAGSSHSILVITPPKWPCLYLTAQQEVLVRTSFLFGSRNDEESCFVARKSFSNLNDQCFLWMGSAWCSACGLDTSSVLHNLRFPVSDGS